MSIDLFSQTLWTSSEADTTNESGAVSADKETSDAPPAPEPEKASE